jgi:hypothetical protein
MAHQSATIALDAYASAMQGDDREAVKSKLKLDIAMAEVTKMLGDLTELLRPYLAKKIG